MAMLAPRTFTTAYAAERATRKPKTRRRTPILTRAGRGLARILPTWHTIRTAVLTLAGFGCLTSAAWQYGLVYGLAALGGSLLVLEYLTGSDDSADR